MTTNQEKIDSSENHFQICQSINCFICCLSYLSHIKLRKKSKKAKDFQLASRLSSKRREALAKFSGFVALRDKRKRRTEIMRKERRIVVEVNRVQRVAEHSHVYTTYCAGCRNKVELVTFQEAAKITGGSIEKIVRRAAKGELHLGLVPEAMLVCLNSLLNIPNLSQKLQTH